MLGTEKGSAGCLDHEARVVELKGDYLLRDAPVFGSGSRLRRCNVPMMTFDVGPGSIPCRQLPATAQLHVLPVCNSNLR
ncbi:hypothetical protein LJ737_26705 [Hymenobacter sp. 15J16-1T3B]|uniref:hypothetical protein n=1 Tax=Hymenobacter sp. 15J16-1T3B TaxID=2886941 RepID=UPI001D1191BE|nr:hypothetical protein [Hymenobacter sp. 15J16-1T3B]MCC3160857.1 hypothetical protein [Hymenobacter sp. 15J16-1T3B]